MAKKYLLTLTSYFKKNNQRHFIVGLLILALYMSFYCFPNLTHILIHDNLDGFLPNLKFITSSSHFFQFNPLMPVEGVLDGLPRGLFSSMFYIPCLFFYFFPPFIAYTLNTIICTLIAYIGIYLLSSRYLLNGNYRHLISTGIALSFAFLPIYYIYGLSVIGIPLLTYSILNIYTHRFSKWDYIIIILFPFYSLLVLSGVFILIALGFFFLWDMYINKKFNKPLFYTISILTFSYVLVEYQLFYTMFIGDSSFVSIRSLWSLKETSIGDAIKNGLDLAIFGHYHAASIHRYILTLIIPLALFFAISNQNIKQVKKLFYLLLGMGIIIIINILLNWEGTIFIREKIEILTTFQWQRFYFLNPTIIYSAFCISLYIICNNYKSVCQKLLPFTKFLMEKDKKDFLSKSLIISIVLLQCFIIMKNNFKFRNTVLTFLGKDHLTNSKTIPLNRYYSPELFADIKHYIGTPEHFYKVVSIGLVPSIPLYNGFSVLDGYFIYSVQYKKQFRKIIEKELQKDKKWAHYFDSWGLRCYLFYTGRKKPAVINNLELNTKQLYDMGGRYIFSAIEIINYQDNNLRFHKRFTKENSLYDIFLYEVL